MCITQFTIIVIVVAGEDHNVVFIAEPGNNSLKIILSVATRNL